MSFESIRQEIVKWNDANLRKLQTLVIALRKLKDGGGDEYPEGSLKHLYTARANRNESERANHQRIPTPDQT